MNTFTSYSISPQPTGLIPCIMCHAWNYEEMGRVPSYWDSSGKNTGMGCHALLQGTFWAQGSNPGLLNHKQILYHLSHQGSPRILEWVPYPLSRGTSQPRNQTRVSYIAGEFFTTWATREAPHPPTAIIFPQSYLANAKSLQSCPTLCDPIDGSPPGSTVPGILQARILEWVAISFSNAWKRKVKVKSLSRVRLLATPWTAAYQAPLSTDFPGKSTGVGYHCLLRPSL